MVVSILIAAILAVVFIAFRVTVAAKSTVGGVIGTMLKALASIGFIAVAITAIFMGGVTGDGISVRPAIFIVAGLIMGLIGDIVLDLKVVYQRSEEEGIYLTSGMVSLYPLRAKFTAPRSIQVRIAGPAFFTSMSP